MTGQNVILSDKDIEMLQRMKKGKYVDPEYDPYKVCKCVLLFLYYFKWKFVIAK